MAAPVAVLSLAVGLTGCTSPARAGRLELTPAPGSATVTSNAALDPTPATSGEDSGADAGIGFRGLTDGDRVSGGSPVRGAATGLPEGLRPWLVAQPVGSSRYFPQSDDLAEGAGGWEVRLDVPEPGRYRLILIGAPTRAHNLLHRALAGRRGLEALPPDVRRLAEVSVTVDSR